MSASYSSFQNCRQWTPRKNWGRCPKSLLLLIIEFVLFYCSADDFGFHFLFIPAVGKSQEGKTHGWWWSQITDAWFVLYENRLCCSFKIWNVKFDMKQWILSFSFSFRRIMEPPPLPLHIYCEQTSDSKFQQQSSMTTYYNSWHTVLPFVREIHWYYAYMKKAHL